MQNDEGGPQREITLRGGPMDGKKVWWSGGAWLEVPSANGVTMWDPGQPREEDEEIVWQDVPYRQSPDDPAIFDYAGVPGDG